MRIENLQIITSWSQVLDAARNTSNKELLGQVPSDKFKLSILKSEHSPIRLLRLSWVFVDIPSFVSVHLVRHKIGIEHFVSTNREDRTGNNPAEITRLSPVRHMCEANAQAIINISKERLCTTSAIETRAVWSKFLEELKLKEPLLYSFCVPKCIYRNGLCPEDKSCHYPESVKGYEQLINYRKLLGGTHVGN